MSKAKSAGKLVSMLRRNQSFLSPAARAQVYLTCIKPIMEYACPVFVNSADYAFSALDRVDACARRLFPTVTMDTLSLRRDVAGLCVLYSVVHHQAPQLVLDTIQTTPLPVSRTTRFNEAVNLAALKIPTSRTESHRNSFLCYYARPWNNLDNATVFAKNARDFKKRACQELRAKR